jgi:hypothetical protein
MMLHVFLFLEELGVLSSDSRVWILNYGCFNTTYYINYIMILTSRDLIT